MLKTTAWLGGVVGTALLTSCSGGGGPAGPSMPSNNPPPPVIRTYSFPTGRASAPNGGIAWNITGIKTTLTGSAQSSNNARYDTLRVDITFAQDVSSALPAPGTMLATGSQLGVAIALDKDGNPQTGTTGTCAGGTTPAPFEYVTDQGNDPSRLSDGNYSITQNGQAIAMNGGVASEAMVALAANTFAETFYLPVIGVVQTGSIAPHIGIAAAIYNGVNTNAVDCEPQPPTFEVFTT